MKNSLINPTLKRHFMKGQRGGIAILTALGFMIFSVPLISASLGLAQTTNIDARVKTSILHRNYCGLAAQEYIDYLLKDTGRLENWLEANDDPSTPGTATATVDLCGQNITIAMAQQADLPLDSIQDPLGDPLITAPPISDYDGREFQTLKTVSNSNPTGGDSVTYTITAINRDTTAATLEQIVDTLPTGFYYDCEAPADQLTLPGTAPQNITPNGDLCPGADGGDGDDSGDGGGGGSCVAEISCINLADIVLVLDNSWSIDQSEMEILKDAAKLLVDSFYLNATDGAIIGVTRFSYWSASLHEMSDDATSLKAAIDGISAGAWDLGFFTNIVAGLEGGEAQYATGMGDRVHPNVMIFITDGDDTTGNSDPEIATAAAATGAEVFAIGVGNNVSQSTLDAIATSPGNSFLADDFNDLIDLIGVLTAPDPIVWDMPLGASIQPGEEATLTFSAVSAVDDGTYCNEAKVMPGEDETRSGKTAIVQIGGGGSGLCSGEAVSVTKIVDSVNLVSTNTATNPYTYTFDVDYTIKVDNIGTENLTIAGFTDLLPVGFSYVSTSPSGDITDAPIQLHQVSSVNRQRVTWQFSPDVTVAPGTAKILTFSTTAAVTRGNYWNDLTVDFGGDSFPEDIYTWPTALISVKDVYDVTATLEGGNGSLVDLQLWVENVSGAVDNWDMS